LRPPIDLYPIVPLTAKFLREMAVMIRRFVFFKNERVPLLIATWILATYIHAHFQYFAILWVNSPVMRCGKSKLLEIIDKLAWKSSGLTIGISPAALFRLTAEGCTLLADEMENLKNSDREQFGAIMGIINAGFAAGATVPRAEKGENGWTVRRYPVYGPKVIAGISTVTDTSGIGRSRSRWLGNLQGSGPHGSTYAKKERRSMSCGRRWRFGPSKTLKPSRRSTAI
jgi:hypothetical protein